MTSKYKSKFMMRCSHAAALMAMVSFSGAAPALANSVVIGGVPVPVYDFSPLAIWAPNVTANTVITVDTTDLVGPSSCFGTGVCANNFGANTTLNIAAGRTVGSGSLLAGAWLIGTTGTTNVVNNGNLFGTVNGLLLESNYGLSGGNLNVSGTGTYGNATNTGYAVYTTVNGGNVAIDGGASYQGGTLGIGVRRFNLAGTIGTVNLGMTTRLGDITARAGNGIWILTDAGTTADGAVNVRAGNITATGGHGILANNYYAPMDIRANSVVTATLDGFQLLGAGGAITASGEGTGSINAGLNGLLISSEYAPFGTGAINVRDFTRVVGGVNGAWIRGDTDSITVSNVGAITGTTGYGLLLGTSSTGNINVQTSGTNGGIRGGIDGIYAGTPAGNIAVGTTGPMGSVTGARNGIWTEAGTGTTAIAGITTISGTSQYGIYSTSTSTGAISVNGIGTATGGLEGIAIGTPSGTISIGNTAALGTVSGGRAGIWTNAGSGNTVISQVGTIRGATQEGIYATSTTTGNISVQSVGTTGGVTGARDGIYTGAVNGNVAIGTTGNNGVITGGRNGIFSWVIGSGNTAIDTTANVTGTAEWGIRSGGVNGNTVINVRSGDVVGGLRGLESLITGTGNATVSVAAGSTVRGSIVGMLTGTASGTSTVNNAGLITSTNAEANTGGDAFYSTAGRSILNNTGVVTGRAYSAGLGLTFNNLAGGVWNPGNNDSGFNAGADFVNNTGLINARAGFTRFFGLETFENRSGGIINMQQGTSPTDDLVVLNFSPLAGSRIRMDFNVDAPLGAIDRGSTGTADTITAVGTVTPTGVSFIDLNSTGGRNGRGEPTALTGSVALIYTGVVLEAPTPGAQLVASDSYSIGSGDPTTITRIFRLVEDGRQGVYLQWVPNISAATMGGFAGGDLSSKDGKGSAMGMARGSVSGAFGAASAIAGQSASAAGGGSGGGSGSGATSSCAASNRDRFAWGQIQTSSSDYQGGGSGEDNSGVIGLDAKIRTTGKNECGRTSAGVFLYRNSGQTNSTGGTADSDGYGAGIYIRTLRESGLYAQLLGTAGTVENDIVNAVFRTTTQSKARNFLLDGTVGYVRPLGAASRTKLDLRGSVSMLDSKSNPFTDNLGFQTTFVASDMLVGQATIGLIRASEKGSSGYVRVGARYSDMTSKSVAYGIVVNTAGDEWGGVAEAGWRARFGQGGEFHIGAFGDFSDSATGFGGRLGLRQAW